MAPVKAALMLLGSRKINKRAALFAESLRARGYAVRFISLPRRPWDMTAFEGETPMPSRPWSAGFDGDRSARTHVVFAMHWLMLPALLFFRLRGLPVFYDECDDYELNSREGTWFARTVSPRLIELTHRLTLPFVNCVFCIHMAGSVLAKKLALFGARAVELNNFPSERWQRRTGSGPSSPLCVVYAGGIWREKGCHDGYVGVGLAQGMGIDVTFHVFGSGDEELTSQLRASGTTVDHGPTRAADIISFLHSNRCVGLALYHDTPRYRLSGTNAHKVFEYLASGTPVLSSSLGEIPQYVTSEVGRVVVNGDNANLLLAFLTELNADPDLWVRMSAQAMADTLNGQRFWEIEWKKAEAVLDAFGC